MRRTIPSEEKYFMYLLQVSHEPGISVIAKAVLTIVLGDLNAIWDSELPEEEMISYLSNRQIGTVLNISDQQVSTKLKELKDWNVLNVSGHRLRKITCTMQPPKDLVHERKMNELRENARRASPPPDDEERTVFKMVRD